MMKTKPHKKKAAPQQPQEPHFDNSAELMAAVMRGEVPADKLQEYANQLEYSDSIAFSHGLLALSIIVSRFKKSQEVDA